MGEEERLEVPYVRLAQFAQADDEPNGILSLPPAITTSRRLKIKKKLDTE